MKKIVLGWWACLVIHRILRNWLYGDGEHEHFRMRIRTELMKKLPQDVLTGIHDDTGEEIFQRGRVASARLRD